jgi:hypothetical protein
MALVLAESFEKYLAGTPAEAGTFNDDNAATANTWTRDTNANIVAASGRFGNQALNCTASGAELQMRFVNTRTASNTLIIQFAFRPQLNGGGAIGRQLLTRVLNASGTTHCSLYVTPGGGFQLENVLNAVVATAQPGQLHMNAWNFIQIKVLLNDAGTFTMNVNNVQVFNAVAGDYSTGVNSISFVWLSGSPADHFFDTVLIMDGSGATFNDFVSDMRYELLPVDADGSVVNWTASAGNDFQCVDDSIGAYNTTDYISSTTTDQDSLFTHTNTGATGTIHFVGQFCLTRADAAAEEIALVCKSGATTDVGVDIPLFNHATTFRWRKRFYTVDPNTSAAWTTANIDAAEFGVRKRV